MRWINGESGEAKFDRRTETDQIRPLPTVGWKFRPDHPGRAGFSSPKSEITLARIFSESDKTSRLPLASELDTRSNTRGKWVDVRRRTGRCWFPIEGKLILNFVPLECPVTAIPTMYTRQKVLCVPVRPVYLALTPTGWTGRHVSAA